MLAPIAYVVAGSLLFTKTNAYLKIMPPYIPWPLAMVRISRVFEILGGLTFWRSASRIRVLTRDRWLW